MISHIVDGIGLLLMIIGFAGLSESYGDAKAFAIALVITMVGAFCLGAVSVWEIIDIEIDNRKNRDKHYGSVDRNESGLNFKSRR